MSPGYTENTVKLQVPDGIDLFYTDSGAPSTTDYTTLVVFHGSAFNGDSFVGLHSHAHKNNLRVLVLNRRDYRGSTKYTDEELEDLKAGKKVFLDRIAIQIASFLEHFIKNEATPKVSADRKSGGFALMGWSFGNATILSLLSDPEVIPKSLYEIIEPYVLTFVMYDPPYTALGYPQPDYDKLYDPWSDPDYPTPAELYDNFQHWVSSYYEHPDIASGKAAGLDYRKRTERTTISGWTDAQKAQYIDNVAGVRSEFPMYAPPMQATLRVQADNALFKEALVTSYFPKANIVYISGYGTCWMCMWSYMEVFRLYGEAVAKGAKVRPIKFHLVKDTNHFVHYDIPDLMLQSIVEMIRADK